MSITAGVSPPSRRITRMVGVATAVGLFVLGVASSPANAIGVGGPTAFGLTPANTANGAPRPYFEFTMVPGQSAQDSVTLSNASSTSETYKLGPATGITSPNSGSSFYESFKPCVRTGCWVTGLPSTVTLGPGKDRTLSFKVSVPEGTAPDQYLAGVTAQPATAPARVAVGSNGYATAQAIVVTQVQVAVVVTVGTLALLTTKLVVGSVGVGFSGSVPRLSVHVSNQGQVLTKALGTISCTQANKTLSYPVVVDTVLPAQSAAVQVNAPGLPTGKVGCTANLPLDNGTSATWSGTLSVPVVKLPTILHTGPGVYSTAPTANSTPAWAIALIVIGSLIVGLGLIALIIVLVRRRHGRHPGSGPEVDSNPVAPLPSTV